MLVKLTTDVNFTFHKQLLCYECVLRSFDMLTVCVSDFWQKNIGKKAARNM